jgi:hypothetical protein
MEQIRKTQRSGGERSLALRFMSGTGVKRLAPMLSMLALCCALSAPVSLAAQTPDPTPVKPAGQAQDAASSADAAFNSAAVPGPTPVSEVPKGKQIPVAGVKFDQGGYMVREEAGQTVDVPFANNNLDVMRFGRSTTGQAYLVNEDAGPVLYVPNHYFVTSNVAESVRWQPLPDSYLEASPIYVSIAPSWDAFIDLDFYPNMVWYGGVWGRRAGYLEAMPHRAIAFGDRSFGYDEYRTYAGEHHGARLARDPMHDRAHVAGGAPAPGARDVAPKKPVGGGPFGRIFGGSGLGKLTGKNVPSALGGKSAPSVGKPASGGSSAKPKPSNGK